RRSTTRAGTTGRSATRCSSTTAITTARTVSASSPNERRDAMRRCSPPLPGLSHSRVWVSRVRASGRDWPQRTNLWRRITSLSGGGKATKKRQNELAKKRFSMLSWAEFYRGLANEATLRAAQMVNASEKDKLEEVAKEWSTLA